MNIWTIINKKDEKIKKVQNIKKLIKKMKK